ncbi:hypothetical protein E6R60_26710 [Streptomyces sp. A0642]|uniref:hypothetical protein n=1 Tax=Streptomyces sp. A0642 TaxID=2563100 RepID=UPI0010A22848|nr:hypothetical protein [Streptomyces sp. A0642]THA72523.1 hypothetical protein E6R60_26710 [Streptomyces sp. A0642]
MRASVAERLLARLRAAGVELPKGTRLVRVYPSESMRNVGAWSWTAANADGVPLYRDESGRTMAVGSQYPMGMLLRLGFEVNRPGFGDFGDITVDPPLAALRSR